MGPVDIAVIVIVGAAFVAVVGTMVYRKIKHKGGGCSYCDGCSGCAHCNCCDSKKK